MFLLPLITSVLQSLHFTFVVTGFDVGLAKPRKVNPLPLDMSADQKRIGIGGTMTLG